MTTNSSSKGLSVKPSYDDDNVFARILRGDLPCQKIYEDEFALAFYDINPQAPVHVLVIPKGQYISFSDFSSTASSNEIAGFIRAVGSVAGKLGVEEPGYRLLANTGLDSHQEVQHFHIHLFAGKPLGPMLTR
jgi:diadenosine tetraphosphate (Ap4A) HIT family hydrolase